MIFFATISICYIIETQLKTKWKRLCAAFEREQIKLRNMASSSAAANVTSNWVHFQSMQFLLAKDDNNAENSDNFNDAVPKESTSKGTPSVISITPTRPVANPQSLNEADEQYLSSLMPYVMSITNPLTKLKFRKEVCDMILNFFKEIEKRSTIEDPESLVENDDGYFFYYHSLITLIFFICFK